MVITIIIFCIYVAITPQTTHALFILWIWAAIYTIEQDTAKEMNWGCVYIVTIRFPNAQRSIWVTLWKYLVIHLFKSICVSVWIICNFFDDRKQSYQTTNPLKWLAMPCKNIQLVLLCRFLPFHITVDFYNSHFDALICTFTWPFNNNKTKTRHMQVFGTMFFLQICSTTNFIWGTWYLLNYKFSDICYTNDENACICV